MQLGCLNEVVIEKWVSVSVLPWQWVLATLPPVVLLLYLQNAQLSFKPTLSAGARQAGWRALSI